MTCLSFTRYVNIMVPYSGFKVGPREAPYHIYGVYIYILQFYTCSAVYFTTAENIFLHQRIRYQGTPQEAAIQAPSSALMVISGI